MQGLLAIWQFFTQAVVSYPLSGIAWHYAWQLGDGVVETATERWLRPYGSLSGPNPLGMYLAAVWVIGLILYMRLASGNQNTPLEGGSRGVLAKWNPLIVTVGQLIILSGLILSFSRGAWIAAAGGAVALMWIAWRQRRVETRLIASLQPLVKQLSFSFLLILSLFSILQPLFTARFTATTRLEIKSLVERKNQYEQAWQIIKERPLWGIGPGTYTLALYNQNPNLPVWQYQPVHNAYLLMLAGIGIVGLFLVFLFFCFFVSLLWRYNPIFLPALAVLFISAFFDHFWISLYAGNILWWATLGLSLSYVNESLARRSPR